MKIHFSTLPVAVSLALATAVYAQNHRRPPVDALTVCRYTSTGQNCSFESMNRTVQGGCISPQGSSAGVCAREHTLRLKIRGKHTASRGGGPRRARKHVINQTQHRLQAVIADTPPISSSEFLVSSTHTRRIITANGVSRHNTGAFPNASNPNTISEQNYHYAIPFKPSQHNNGPTEVWTYNFGIGVDPAAAEWYLGVRNSKWQYAALSGALPLGLDEHFAHVQPTGAYHYHGKPAGLIDNLNIDGNTHSGIVGWAADGYPIYAQYGHHGPYNPLSEIIELNSSYAVKTGARPSGNGQPGGYYDGTFTADYQYVPGMSTLDECNGRFARTPEYPDGTYAYYLTENWPQIPRCFKGTPDPSFRKRPAGRRSTNRT